MITLSQLNQYAATNNINSNTDIFSILSLMNLHLDELSEVKPKIVYPETTTSNKENVEWTFEQVIDLQGVLYHAKSIYANPEELYSKYLEEIKKMMPESMQHYMKENL